MSVLASANNWANLLASLLDDLDNECQSKSNQIDIVSNPAIRTALRLRLFQNYTRHAEGLMKLVRADATHGMMLPRIVEKAVDDCYLRYMQSWGFQEGDLMVAAMTAEEEHGLSGWDPDQPYFLSMISLESNESRYRRFLGQRLDIVDSLERELYPERAQYYYEPVPPPAPRVSFIDGACMMIAGFLAFRHR